MATPAASPPSAPADAATKDIVPTAVEEQTIGSTANTEISPDQKKPARPSTILHRKVSSKRLVGRLPISPSPGSSASQSRVSLVANQLLQEYQQEGVQSSQTTENEDLQTEQPADTQGAAGRRLRLSAAGAAFTGLMEQLKDWAHTERERQKTRREKRAAKIVERRASQKAGKSPDAADKDNEEHDDTISPISSGDESGKAALDAFDAILAAAEASNSGRPTVQFKQSKRKSSKARSLKGGHTSDTDYASDGEPVVPACEVILPMVEELGMDEFKNQVLRLAHTLRCKGWRRITLDRYKEISVERISGALTNAVFVVSPPSELPPVVTSQDPQGSTVAPASMKLPAKLLLRIYGPQASHLIDRDSELSILRRLARKRIGPRLLGTFENGRFEEFLPSRTLTRDDIRIPETSRHIAKRLKELHEGIDLEAKERERGPIVWSNWDKWVPRVRGIMAIIEASDREEGPVLGTSWEKFESVVLRYRQWLEERYGGPEGVKNQLIFAHNDTQYGNILRLQAGGKSPLLLPMNEHKQLVVIDFEYANANHPGFEIANHFCEWMSNYHGTEPPHMIYERHYPNPEQQRNFIRAYVEHRLAGAYSSKTPSASSTDLANLDARGVPSFNLDSRAPAMPYKEEEAARQHAVEKEIDKFVEETLVWRPAAHAMWCAWGVIQAKIQPTGSEQKTPKKSYPDYKENTLSEEAKNAANDMEDRRSEDEDEFDYLRYCQQRALLFWGDMLKLGIVKPEEVDEFALHNVKRVEY